jgi:hypothetical protein
MHPLSDKDLDRLSREAADQYDVEQNTSGWEKLQHMLNKHLPETGKKERSRFLLLLWLFALLSGGGLLWILTIDKDSNLLTRTEQTSKATLPVDQNKETLPPLDNTVSKKDNPNTKTDNPEKPHSEPKTVDATKSDLTRTNPGELTIEKQTPASDVTPEKKILNQKESAKNVRQKSFLQSRNRNTHPEQINAGKADRQTNSKFDQGTKSSIPSNNKASGKPAAENTIAGTDKQQKEDISAPETSSSSPVGRDEKKIPSAADETPIEADNAAIPDSAATPEKKSVAKVKTAFNKGLELGLVGSPDMSNVKFSHTDNIGFSAGVQIGYRFSKRLSVNTGLLYTGKNYTTRGRDFTPPKGTWLDNVLLEEVEGNCFMFDIPLNIRYDLNTGNKHRYFVSTGLSTYLMKNEHYDYYYRYANGSTGNRYRSHASTERYWFSILNFSAGFEKSLSKKVSLQVEPYFKIPLQGVGYGNLQLNSYGMFFSLKYKPAFGSAKK